MLIYNVSFFQRTGG